MANKIDLTHPVDKGYQSEAIIMAELARRGLLVLIPFGFNNRYDFVIETGHRHREGFELFARVQCKTGRYRDGSVHFDTCSTTPSSRRSYKGEVDTFLVYCPDLNKVYWVPMEEVGDRLELSLRVDPPKNNQMKGIRWAKDFDIETMDLFISAMPT